MKKMTLSLVMVTLAIAVIAQTPQAFKYQAIARSNLGEPIINQLVSIRVSLLEGGVSGTAVYTETFQPTTNPFGLFSLEIGNGADVTGEFAGIDWGNNIYFMQIEMDETGSNNYQWLGTSQLLSVPYSQYSAATGDTSRWRKSNDDLYFNNGYVGIGTTTPSYNLDLKSSSIDLTSSIRMVNSDFSKYLRLSSGNDTYDPAIYFSGGEALRFMNYDGGYSELMRINSDGKVGIGTTNPSFNLDILSSSTDFTSRIKLANSDNSKELYLSSGSDTKDPHISFQGANALRFMQYDGGYNELMRITSDRKVGIGTENPLGNLDIHGNDSARIYISPAGIANSLSTAIMFKSTFGGTVPDLVPRNIGLIKAHFDGGGWETAALSFHVSGDDCHVDSEEDPCERLRITSGGNVGIGTENPEESALLELNSDSKGFLPPAMTESSRIAIASPATGLLVYQTTAPAGYYYYNGANWIGITGTGPGAISTTACIDYDGNAYPTFIIGNQMWMAENLRVTHYRNGEDIPEVTDYGAWSGLTSGAYCWYDNNQTTNGMYGTLYNWYTVDDSRGLCPEGWHVPTDVEWTTLTTYLGGTDVAGGKMKATSDLWDSPNSAATNASKFSGLPGGYRYNYGNFTDFRKFGFWWSSTEGSSSSAWGWSLIWGHGSVIVGNDVKESGFSVRCLRDN